MSVAIGDRRIGADVGARLRRRAAMNGAEERLRREGGLLLRQPDAGHPRGAGLQRAERVGGGPGGERRGGAHGGGRASLNKLLQEAVGALGVARCSPRWAALG
ncbi:MAG: hypothetical protein CMH57_09250 [Myxococcales bacterium]|nr:hypothetical protein [Myxococcales bacterium]